LDIAQRLEESISVPRQGNVPLLARQRRARNMPHGMAQSPGIDAFHDHRRKTNSGDFDSSQGKVYACCYGDLLLDCPPGRSHLRMVYKIAQTVLLGLNDPSDLLDRWYKCCWIESGGLTEYRAGYLWKTRS
jgi:hypothetical protein